MPIGTTLKYTGGKATEFSKREDLSPQELFSKAIINAGAFAIRVRLAQTQRAILLQNIAREDYHDDYLGEPGEGNNAPNLFEPAIDATKMRKLTRKLEKFAHYSLGRGKLIDERARRLKVKNTDDLAGEEHLWDFLHAPLWGIGINLASQLSNQGFIYVIYPTGMTAAEYERVSKELEDGQFERISIDDEIKFRTASGYVLNTCKFNQIQISMDPEQIITQQKNGFVITHQNQSAPVGWTIHTNRMDKSKLVNPIYTIDFIRTIRTAQGGSHLLTDAEYEILINQSRGATEAIRSTQNAAINVIDDFARVLAQDFDFNPLPLLGNSIQLSYKRIQASMAEVDVIDDLLTGVLITEMVQPLRKTQPLSTRSSLPMEFNDSFDISLNIIKAFAYAYDLKKPDGSFVFNADDIAFSEPDGELIDVRMRGKLQLPDLLNPKHIASLIAVGVLVAEQMILEQLLRDAVVSGEDHPNAMALRDILQNDATYHQLVMLARSLPSDSFGPILGLQISACDEIVYTLRKELGFDQLIQIADDLYEANEVVAFENVSAESKDAALHKLYQIGKVLQQVDSTSVASENSRGINAGIILVIARIAPTLYRELEILEGFTPMPDMATPSMRIIQTNSQHHGGVNNSLYNVSACPFMSRQKKSMSRRDDNHVMEMPAELPATSTSQSWFSFFGQRAMPMITSVSMAVTSTISDFLHPRHAEQPGIFNTGKRENPEELPSTKRRRQPGNSQ